jgi:hypothetical protein
MAPAAKLATKGRAGGRNSVSENKHTRGRERTLGLVLLRHCGGELGEERTA